MCKYFVYRQKHLPCHNLGISTECTTAPTFCERSLYLHPDDMDTVTLGKFRITNYLEIVNYQNYNSIFSNLVKIVVCDIKYLDLCSQEITLEELSLLPIHQIQSVSFNNVAIRENNRLLPVENLFCLFPNAKIKM